MTRLCFLPVAFAGLLFTGTCTAWSDGQPNKDPLVVFGTGQEWSQDKSDIRAKWNDIGQAYHGILDQRATARLK